MTDLDQADGWGSADEYVEEDEPGSRLIETAARAMGLSTQRLSKDLVLCRSPLHQVAFKGLTGAKISTVARSLSRDGEKLRRYLALRGLPVADEPGREITYGAVVDSRVIAALRG